MTQGTDEGGAPAEAVADVGTSGDGHGVDEGPFLSSEEPQYQLVEWRQSALAEFSNVEEAAATWAALDNVEQKAHWWKVEILEQVAKNKWMSEFLKELKGKYNIDLSQRYANELRRLGNDLSKVSARAPALAEKIQKLPVTTALKVLRADDVETAVEVAATKSRKNLEMWLRTEKLDASEFKPKIYDIWSFNARDPRYGQADYKWGLICGQIVENLLHYYTEPGDFVLDPMAGGGTTIDVCNAFERTCMAFDIEPVRDDIFQHDITTGPPLCDPCPLVILEPPYYNMKQDAYESLTAYREFLRLAIRHSVEKLRPGGYLALIVMDQVNKDREKYPIIGPSYRLLELAGLKYEHLVGLPLTTEQHTAYHVERAKREKIMLGINRQMWIFRRPEP